MVKVIPVVIELLSVTRVGSTGVYFDYSSADIVTYKLPLSDSEGVYYIPAIPATSFKGLLRSTYEKYLRRKEVSDQEKMNILESIKREVNNNSSNEIVGKLTDEVKEELLKYASIGLIKDFKQSNDLVQLLRIYLEVTGWNSKEACYVTSDLDQCVNLSIIEDEKVKKERELWQKLMGRDKICKVCSVLGTSGVRGKVKFTDMIAVDPFPVFLERTTHISINRLTGTAEKGKLFTEEIIPPGVKFLGFAVILEDSVLDQVLDMLKVLKDKADRGEVWIGGRGTSGYGTFKLYLPPEEIKFSTRSLLEEGLFKLKYDEPKREGAVIKTEVIKRLFPISFMSTLEKVTEGEPQHEVWYEVITDDNQVIKTENIEELNKTIGELEKAGKKYKIVSHGEYHL
ncbi:MAG: RAMP superfamily CRISPR-associated protein [Sulfolobaceae archaeon]|nr:RAMP superfamily CRISPR-associated protein [Sulfolobaceae archaeon]